MRRDTTLNKLGYKTTRSVACIAGKHLTRLVQSQNSATRLVFGYQFKSHSALSQTRRHRRPAPQNHTALSIDDVVYEVTERGALAFTLAVEPGIGIRTRSVCLIRIMLAVTLPNALRLRLLGHASSGWLLWRIVIILSVIVALHALHARVRANLGAIDRNVPPRDNAGRYAAFEHLLKQAREDIAARPTLVTKTRKRRMVGDGIVKVEPAEPSIAGVHTDLVAELAIGQVIEYPQNHHAQDEFGIDAWSPPARRVTLGESFAHETQIERSIYLAKPVALRNERLDVDHLEECRFGRIFSDHVGRGSGEKKTHLNIRNTMCYTYMYRVITMTFSTDF